MKLTPTSLKGVSGVNVTLLHWIIWSPGRSPALRARPFSFVNCTNIPGFQSGPLQILKRKHNVVNTDKYMCGSGSYIKICYCYLHSDFSNIFGNKSSYQPSYLQFSKCRIPFNNGVNSIVSPR